VARSSKSLETPGLEDRGALTSHYLMGFHGLLHGKLFFLSECMSMFDVALLLETKRSSKINEGIELRPSLLFGSWFLR
jgi:hypothetical protein